jgi:hypothetical protein
MAVPDSAADLIAANRGGVHSTGRLARAVDGSGWIPMDGPTPAADVGDERKVLVWSRGGFQANGESTDRNCPIASHRDVRGLGSAFESTPNECSLNRGAGFGLIRPHWTQDRGDIRSRERAKHG